MVRFCSYHGKYEDSTSSVATTPIFLPVRAPPCILSSDEAVALSALELPRAGIISPVDALATGACDVRHESPDCHLIGRPHALPNVLVEHLEPPSL